MIAPARSFEEAWEASDRIDGWLSWFEARALYEAADSTPEDSTIVEIGAYKGRSTVLLAETGRWIWTFDPLVPGSKTGCFDIENTVADELAGNLRPYSRVYWRREPASSFVRRHPIPNVSLLYIDGDHRWPAPHDDFQCIRPFFVPGAIAAFHDFESERGVTESVRALESEGLIERRQVVGSLYLGDVL